MIEREPISNKRVLDLVDEQVSRVEAEFERLAKLEQSLDAARATAGKLALESKRIKDNVDGLSKSKRVGLLQNNAAAISLEESDALMIERSIAAAKEHAVLLGQAAKSSCSEILWALATTRRSNARAALEAILDFSVVGGQKLETAARSVRELQPLQYYFGHSATAHEADYQLASLHQLRVNFSQVRAMCEAEPALTIPAITVVKPAAVAVAEYEPAATTNRLGTLAKPALA